MYGSQAIQQTIDSETKSGYNSFGGKSLFDNENSVRSRTRYVQDMLNQLSKGSWNGYSAADIFGSKVAPAEFQNRDYAPTDYGQVQGKTIADNQQNLPAILDLVSGINGALRNDSGARIEQFAPGFTDNLKTMTNSSKALLGGQLPYSDVLDIVANRQELGNSMGTAGTYGNATLKDLGLSRLQAQQTGSEMMSRIGNLVESIDPIGQRSRPQDWTLAPNQTVPLKQADTQFGATFDQMERILAQQSEQNANVLNAAADPASRGIFGAQYSLKTGTPLGGAGGAGGSGGVDWGGLVSSIYGAYRNSQANQAGGQQPTSNNDRFIPDSQWGTSYGNQAAPFSSGGGAGNTGWDGYAASVM